MKIEIDDSDRVILSMLQEDSNHSLEQLSEACGLSVPTVQRRLKRLREKKIISREVAVVDAKAVGYPMTFIVMVEMEHENLQGLTEFKLVSQAETAVQQCYYVTGEADFCLICTSKDMDDFEVLTHRLFFNNKNVRRFRTSVVMNRNKVTLDVPL